MSVEFYLNGSRVYLDPKKVVAITKQVVDLNSLREIRSDFSNSIDIPPVDANTVVLEHIDQIGSTSDLPYVKNKAKLVVDGVEIISNGVGLVEVVSDQYKVTAYSGNKSWLSLIEGLSIRDLDFTAEKHVWNLAAFIDSHENSRPYLYPVISYGLGLDYRPWVYCKEILQRIFSAIGYTIQGEILSDVRYLGSIIECSEIDPVKDFFIGAAEVNTIGAPGYITHEQDDNAPTPGQEPWLQFNNETLDPMQPYAPPGVIEQNPPAYFFGGPKTVYNCLKAGTYSFELFLDMQQIYAFSSAGTTTANVGWELFWFVNGTPQAFTDIVRPAGGSATRFSKTIKRDVVLSAPGYITWQVRAISISSNFNKLYRFNLFDGSYLKCTEALLQGTTSSGDLVDLSKMLPDISQAEFVKAIGYMTGSVIIPDETTKTVSFRKWSVLGSQRQNAIDWSSKIVTTKKPEIRFRFGSWAQRNWLRYNECDDVPYGYGDASMNISDEWLESDRDIYVSPFSACLHDQNGVPVIPRRKTEDGQDIWFTADNPRILMTDIEGAQTVLGTPLSQFKYAYFKDLAYPNSLGFDSFIVPDNYRFIEAMILKPKVVLQEFLLGAQDVHRFDHFVPVYIKRFSDYFFVNKISNWVSDKPTQVELIRL